MPDNARKQFGLDEIAPVFVALEKLAHPCVLIGGQAVCFWARRYLSEEPALQEFEAVAPFVSKDVDFHGDRDGVIAFAHELGCRAEIPRFRETFGNIIAGKFLFWIGVHGLSVEVLRMVPGLSTREVRSLSLVDLRGNCAVRLLNPIGVLMAKSWNVARIEQEGRHDVEQLLATLVCVRAFLRGALRAAGIDRRALRTTLNLVEQALAFTESPDARRAVERSGVDWSQILPHRFIAASAQPELVRLREQRVPRWLRRIAPYRRPVPENPTVRRLLEILATHAEPLCAQPAARATHRKSKIGKHKSPSP
jgi:hypothetical protein